jgi:hypothetical protein
LSNLYLAAGFAILAGVALASNLEVSDTQLCIHKDCLSGVNYCEYRYSYVKIIAGEVTGVKYLVPQNVPQTQTFDGTCVDAAIANYNPNQ